MDEPDNILMNAVREHTPATFHQPEGVLIFPYLDPGGVYSKSLWDWDSFWALTGVLGIARKNGDEQLKQQALEHGIGVIKNFFHHQATDGSLPILITVTDHDCFDTANPKNNMAKPVFGQFCELLSSNITNFDQHPDCQPWLEALQRFYNCYEHRYRHAATGLYAWANDVAIGVDDDPATWGRPPFSSANMFLNCFLYRDLNAAAKFARKSNAVKLAEGWELKARKLAASINEFCWDERDGIYYSVDLLCQQNISEHRIFGQLNVNLTPFWKVLPLKVMSWVSFLPLWCGIASPKQAQRMVEEQLLNEQRFWCEYGIRTLSADERMYSPAMARGNPSNWLGPVWIISNYIIWLGLSKNGFTHEAELLAQRTQALLEADLKNNGYLHENYNPNTGKGIAAPRFWNWNILACLMS